MPKVNPDIMKWARESAGLTLDDAAELVIGGGRAVERLTNLEAGRVDPTRAQLCAMAKRYHRPLLTFYLPDPPTSAARTHDFRTLPGRETGSEGILNALVRDLQARQELVVAALEDSDEAERLPFVGSLPKPASANALANAIVQTCKLDMAAFRQAKDVDASFKILRDAVEHAGVFVILQGNLGHFSTNISAHVFRGLALSDAVAPFIVINETDARTAWSFTLLHELGHVLLGRSGISGYDSNDTVEKLCDAAAAYILLGPDGVSEVGVARGDAFDDVLTAISRFARSRNVSRKMVAYNLMQAAIVSSAGYVQLSQRFDEERAEADLAKKGSGGGGDYYVTRRHRVGSGLIRLVDRLVAGGTLTSVTAGKVLGVRPTAVGRMTSDPRAA